MLEFSVGEKVLFSPPGRGPIIGVLVKYNKKTVTVLTEEGQNMEYLSSFTWKNCKVKTNKKELGQCHRNLSKKVKRAQHEKFTWTHFRNVHLWRIPQVIDSHFSEPGCQAAFDLAEIAFARSFCVAPKASKDLIRRSIDTDGEPASIFATLDWLDLTILANSA